MISVTCAESSPGFDKALRKAPPDIVIAALAAIKLLTQNPEARSLRLHALKGHKPTIWKIDVLPNKSWQIAMNIYDGKATLLRIATHKEMDGRY